MQIGAEKLNMSGVKSMTANIMSKCNQAQYLYCNKNPEWGRHLFFINMLVLTPLSCLYYTLQAKSLVLAAIVGSAAAFAPVPNMATRSCTSLNSVEDQVRELVKEQLGVDGEFENSAAFIADLEADSLDAVELIMALEEEFEIEIPDEEVEGITTVQAAIDFVEKAKA